MFRLNQIYAVLTLILLNFLQFAESRAGGWECSGFSSGGGWGHSYSSQKTSNKDSIYWFFPKIGIIFVIVLYVVIANYIIEQKIEKKHKEIIMQLSNRSITEFLWDEKEIISSVKQSFIDLQKAWSEQNLDFIERKLSQNLFREWKDKLIEMRIRNETNVVSNVIVKKIRFVELDKQEKIFTVSIDANANDVTRNLSSGKTLKNQRGGFLEFWTYKWGIDSWLLMEISQLSEFNL